MMYIIINTIIIIIIIIYHDAHKMLIKSNFRRTGERWLRCGRKFVT